MNGQQQMDYNQQQQQQQYFQQADSKARPMSTPNGVGHIPPPSTAPPQSLLEARPYSRRGPNDSGPPTNSSQQAAMTPSGYQQQGGGSNQRDRGLSNTFNRDGSSDIGEYLDTAAVDIHDYQNGVRARPISIDDLV